MRVNGGAKLLGLGASCLLALAGCTSSDPGLTADLPIDVPPAAVAPTFDVADVITRARTSFREQDGRLVAGVDTHMVESQGDAIAVTPTHWPRAEAAPLHGLEAAPSLSTSLTAGVIRAETPFVVRTASIARGAARLDGADPLRTVRDGGVQIARGAVVEHVRDGASGVEQSWRFGARPSGEGDLVVRVAVESSEWTHRGTSERGEHFADPATGLGVSYGHGTWIDASGVRTAVPVRYDGTALVLSVPDRVLASSAYPAVLDPIIGPEITMGAPTTGPIAGDQWNPAIASNGTHWLVVYGDQLFGSFDLYGIRVASTGVAVESTGFPIVTEAGDQHLPSATWNGTRWIVAWQDSRTGTNWDVYATTVESSGTVAAGGGTAIAATPLPELRVRVASAGAVTLATWTAELTVADDTDPLAVQATRIGVSGVLADAAPTTIATNSRGFDPAVAGSASNFLVTWSTFAGTSTANLQGQRINATGPFLADALPLTVADLGLDSSVAWNGTSQWLVAYNGVTDRNIIQSVLVPTTGAVSLPVPTMISGATGEQVDPVVAWNGTSYLVAYVDAIDDTFASTSVRATQVSAANTVIGTPGITLSGTGGAFEAHVAAMGTTFLVIWTEILTTGADVQGKRVSAAGAVLDATPRTYSVGTNHQLGPVVASDGAGFLVAWTDTVNAEIDVYGVRVSAAGAMVGSIAVLADNAVVSDIAHFGSVYVLTLNQAGNAFAVNVASATGVPATPYALANDVDAIEGNASVACHASLGCLAAWEQAPMEGAEDDVYARRFDPVTGVLQAAAAVTIAPGNQFGTAVAASSTQFLIAFTDVRDAAMIDVRAARFTTTPQGVSIIGGAADIQTAPDVASDGTDFLVVWQDRRSGGATPADVYAARVAGGTGASLDGLGFAIAASPASDEFGGAVAYDGGQYLVTWSRDLDVFGSRVTPAGTVVDAASPIAISTASDAQGNSSVAAATGGPFLATYVTVDASGANRARARTIGRDPTGTMCTSGADCVTGSCVDGVCCGTATCGAGQVCSIAAGGTSDGTCTMLPVTDAGVADAGTDAGTTDDAGMTIDEDGGVIDEDGGIIDEDGGVLDEDGGVTPEEDASVAEADGGVTPPVDSGLITGDGGVITPPDDGGGCSCSVPGGDERRAPYAPLSLAGLAFAALIARRRRSR